MFVGPVDAACVPVSPINKLPKHCHSKGVDSCADNNFPICACERRSLNLLSDRENKKSSDSEKQDNVQDVIK